MDHEGSNENCGNRISRYSQGHHRDKSSTCDGVVCRFRRCDSLHTTLTKSCWCLARFLGVIIANERGDWAAYTREYPEKTAGHRSNGNGNRDSLQLLQPRPDATDPRLGSTDIPTGFQCYQVLHELRYGEQPDHGCQKVNSCQHIDLTESKTGSAHHGVHAYSDDQQSDYSRQQSLDE